MGQVLECVRLNCPSAPSDGLANRLDLTGDYGRCLLTRCNLARFLSGRSVTHPPPGKLRLCQQASFVLKINHA